MNIRLVGTRPLRWLRASLPLLLGTALLIPRIAVAADGLRVGSAAVDLEADDSMIIAGGIEGGRAKGQEGKLRCVAVVIEKDDARVAIVACDVLMLTRRSLDPVMAEIQQRFGIPSSHTLINCTHTHHAPSTMKVHDYGPDEVFTRRVQEGIVRAVGAAFSNRTDARLFFQLGEERTVGQNSRVLLDDGRTFWIGPRTNFVRPTGPLTQNCPCLRFVIRQIGCRR